MMRLFIFFILLANSLFDAPSERKSRSFKCKIPTSAANEDIHSTFQIEKSRISKSGASRHSFCFLSFQTPCQKFGELWFCHASDSEQMSEITKDQRRCISTTTVKFDTDPATWMKKLSEQDFCVENVETVFSEKARDTSWRLKSFLSLGVGVAIMLCIWLLWEETPKKDNDFRETFLSHNI